MMNLVKRNVLSLIIGGVALVGLAAPSALAQDSKPGKDGGPTYQPKDGKEGKEKETTAAAKVGEQAPAFTLTDTAGKTVKLEDYKGKIVVIDWFNPDCPVCAGHYKANTVQNLVTKYKDKPVVFLAINSGGAGMQGAGVERNTEAKKTWNLAFPILLDESGKVGKLYGAKTTPHCYVIDAKGTLVYAGAIDDGAENHGGKIGKVNYVEKAVDQTLKGETVTTTTTKPYGCSVKYGKGA